MMMAINKSYVYEICIEGLLPDRWSDWFDGLTIQVSTGDKTILRGRLADQAALLGVLTRIHGLNLGIITANRMPTGIEHCKSERAEEPRQMTERNQNDEP